MTHTRRATLAVLLLMCSLRVQAADSNSGGLVGWVEDQRGAPVAGALISLFGRGLQGAGLVTRSDSAGRFSLPYLPPGSYTLRAMGDGHLPALARGVKVQANRDSIFNVSLAPEGAAEARTASIIEQIDTEAAGRERELEWLLRHKRRSVLEALGPRRPSGEDQPSDSLRAAGTSTLAFASLDGTVELLTSPHGDTPSAPGGVGVLRLRGPLTEHGHWSVGGLLSEAEDRGWRMAAEFVLEPANGHHFRAGSGYGSRLLRPRGGSATLDEDGVGAIYLQDRWDAGRNWSVTAGARFSYIGFVRDTNHVDPTLSFEARPDKYTTLRGAVSSRTLVPGGDLLTMSSLATAPSVAFAIMDAQLRPEHITRYELAMEQSLDEHTTLSAHGFYESVDDQLVNAFDPGSSLGSLRIGNGGHVAARGMGLSLGRTFGDSFRGALTYTYGRSSRGDDLFDPAALSFDAEGDFHDVATRLETSIEASGTRVVAFYRLNIMPPTDRLGGGGRDQTVTNTRFDVQLAQNLPFLSPLTRADWEFLFAVRNLFYEAEEAATLDEVVTVHPPKRVLGGLSVRF